MLGQFRMELATTRHHSCPAEEITHALSTSSTEMQASSPQGQCGALRLSDLERTVQSTASGNPWSKYDVYLGNFQSTTDGATGTVRARCWFRHTRDLLHACYYAAAIWPDRVLMGGTSAGCMSTCLHGATLLQVEAFAAAFSGCGGLTSAQINKVSCRCQLLVVRMQGLPCICRPAFHETDTKFVEQHYMCNVAADACYCCRSNSSTQTTAASSTALTRSSWRAEHWGLERSLHTIVTNDQPDQRCYHPVPPVRGVTTRARLI